jgi:hypothetical protein
MKENLNDISKHVKKKRKQNKLTQPELASKSRSWFTICERFRARKKYNTHG